jgi:hypothetical protein
MLPVGRQRRIRSRDHRAARGKNLHIIRVMRL